MDQAQLEHYQGLIARGEPIPFGYGDRQLVLNPEPAALYHLQHSVEKLVRLAGTLPESTRTIVDVGANVGLFAAFAAMRLPAARVLAFEPAPDLVPYARRNAEGLNVLVDPRAVGDEPGTAVLHVNPVSQQTNSLVPEAVDVFVDASVGSRPERVDVVRLDDAVAEHGMSRVDVLKVDVQGFEGAVFRGARQALRDAALVLVESTWMDVESMTQVVPMGLEYGFTHLAVLGNVHLGADVALSREPLDDVELSFELDAGLLEPRWW